MNLSLLPRYFNPGFTWPNHISPTITTQIPDPPRATHPQVRLLWGIIHKYLRRFSRSYCSWVGIPYDNQVAQLPFGLILKWSDGTRLEEVLTMQVTRKTGLPVPKVICYGEHPDSPHAPVSILMTKIPGDELGSVYDTLSNAEREAIQLQLKGYLEAIRKWESTAIRSVRVPNHLAGPFESEHEFNEYLLKPAWSGGFPSEMEYNNALDRARKMDLMSHHHRIVLTHGDLKHHNILVRNGRITGLLDWESAGWCPGYWDFTTAIRFAPEDFWWYDFVVGLGGDKYMAELDCERALTSLTSSSYSW